MKMLRRLAVGATTTAVLATLATPALAGKVNLTGKVENPYFPGGTISAELKTQKKKPKRGKSYTIPKKVLSFEVTGVSLQCASSGDVADFESPTLKAPKPVKVKNYRTNFAAEVTYEVRDPGFPGVFTVKLESDFVTKDSLDGTLQTTYYPSGEVNTPGSCYNGSTVKTKKAGGK